MRVPLLVCVLLYLAVELLGARLAAVDWTLVTPLMVASAVADALLVVSVLVAVLVVGDLTKHRWRPALRSRLRSRATTSTGWPGGQRRGRDDHAEVVGVPSWRPVPAAPQTGSTTAASTGTYETYAVRGGPARPGRPFPVDDGTLI